MKKPDPTQKPVKYLLARAKGKNKKEAALAAGYSKLTSRVPYMIERTQPYQEAREYYASKLQGKISLDEIAEAHADNIFQDKDRAARNKAIELALEKIEPTAPSGEDESVIVILKSN